MSFAAPPPTLKRSRYFDSGSPTRCHYCGRRFDGAAIRASENNRYFCSDSCLETEQIIRFSSQPRKAS
jgi:hypothetical protein